jgi:hypothetical protein
MYNRYPAWQGAMKEAERNVSRKNKKAIDEAAAYAVK